MSARLDELLDPFRPPLLGPLDDFSDPGLDGCWSMSSVKLLMLREMFDSRSQPGGDEPRSPSGVLGPLCTIRILSLQAWAMKCAFFSRSRLSD